MEDGLFLAYARFTYTDFLTSPYGSHKSVRVYGFYDLVTISSDLRVVTCYLFIRSYYDVFTVNLQDL